MELPGMQALRQAIKNEQPSANNGPDPAHPRVAGTVKNIKGQAFAEGPDGARLGLKEGDKVYDNQIIRTGPDGAIGIVTPDNTLLSSGPQNSIDLHKLSAGESAKPAKLQINTSRLKKNTPESIDFHTPTTMLGVRG